MLPALVPTIPEPVPSTSAASADIPAALPAQILEALGDPKPRDEIFGPKIQEEISKRWGRVLLDGLNKEQKLAIKDKVLIPENFKLANAKSRNSTRSK